jgi:hypothetical protein
MGVPRSLGYVEARYGIADILLLNSNLKDITATQDIFALVKNGHYYNRQHWMLMLDTARQKKNSVG